MNERPKSQSSKHSLNPQNKRPKKLMQAFGNDDAINSLKAPTTRRLCTLRVDAKTSLAAKGESSLYQKKKCIPPMELVWTEPSYHMFFQANVVNDVMEAMTAWLKTEVALPASVVGQSHKTSTFGFTISRKDPCKLKCVAFISDETTVSFTLRLFRSRDSPDRVIFEASRRAGCVMVFSALYAEITAYMQNNNSGIVFSTREGENIEVRAQTAVAGTYTGSSSGALESTARWSEAEAEAQQSTLEIAKRLITNDTVTGLSCLCSVLDAAAFSGQKLTQLMRSVWMWTADDSDEPLLIRTMRVHFASPEVQRLVIALVWRLLRGGKVQPGWEPESIQALRGYAMLKQGDPKTATRTKTQARFILGVLG